MTFHDNLHHFALRIQTGVATRVLKPIWNMFSKVQTDNHNLRKNVTINEEQILRKMGLKFHKIAFYMYFVFKFPLFEVKKPLGIKEAAMEQAIVAE